MRDATLEQQVFDVPKRQRVADVHKNDEPDDLGRGVEPAKRVVGFLFAGHPNRLTITRYPPVHLP